MPEFQLIIHGRQNLFSTNIPEWKFRVIITGNRIIYSPAVVHYQITFYFPLRSVMMSTDTISREPNLAVIIPQHVKWL